MVRTQLLLTDVQGTQVQELSLLILALVIVKVSEIVETESRKGMVRTQLLLCDLEGTQVQGFSLAIAATFMQIMPRSIEQTSHLYKHQMSLFNKLSTSQSMW